MTKMYFSWESDTGIYAGFGQAHPSPREPGKYLLPAYATFEIPLICKQGEIAVWTGAAWRTVKLDEAPSPKINFWTRIKNAYKFFKNEQ